MILFSVESSDNYETKIRKALQIDWPYLQRSKVKGQAGLLFGSAIKNQIIHAKFYKIKFSVLPFYELQTKCFMIEAILFCCLLFLFPNFKCVVKNSITQ